MRSSLVSCVFLASVWTGCSSANRPTEVGTLPILEAGLLDRTAPDAASPRGDGSPNESATDEASPDVADETAIQPDDGGLDDQTTPSTDGSNPSDGANPSDAAAAAADAPRSPPDFCLPACVHGVCSPSAGYCSCDVGWAGPACDIAAPAPAPGMPVSGTVTAGQWVYYTFEGMATGLSATLTEDSTVGLVWLYLDTNQTPDRSNYLKKNEDTQSSSHTVSRSFASPGVQLWYVAAYGQPGIAPGQTVPYHVTITVIP